MDSFLKTVFQDADGAWTRIKFGAGIAPTDLKLGLGSLKISVGCNPNDAIHLQNFNANDVLGSRLIDSFEFADGTVLTYAQLIAQGFDLNGTTGNDTISGTNLADGVLVMNRAANDQCFRQSA